MTETFQNYMSKFLKDRNTPRVVEVGSDVQLKLAYALARHCSTLYSVNLPTDCIRMQGWYEMATSMGGQNIERIRGNCLELSKLMKKADVILLQNVLIDGANGEDTKLMWQYRRGEVKPTKRKWDELITRFNQYEETAYREFLKVANPGVVIRYNNPNPEEDQRFRDMLVNKLRVKPSRITTIPLTRDDQSESWEACFIDNS